MGEFFELEWQPWSVVHTVTVSVVLFDEFINLKAKHSQYSYFE